MADNAIRSIIRHEIEAKGLKQAHVARKSGMRVDSFSAFLNGNRKLRAEELILVSEFLGIPLTRYQDTIAPPQPRPHDPCDPDCEFMKPPA